MNPGNLQITLKVKHGNVPNLLKILPLMVHIWAWVERVKCKIFHRTPCRVNIGLSMGGG